MSRVDKRIRKNQPPKKAMPKKQAQKQLRRPKNGNIHSILENVVYLCIIVMLVLGGMTAMKKVVIPVATMYHDAKEIVDKSDKDTFRTGQPSIVYDAAGNELKKMRGEKEVSYLTYDKIPDAAKLAIISIEDKTFTRHRGISVEGILRSVLSLIKNRGNITMGGSTITQQLSRNIFLNFDETYSRKVKEIFISIALEEKYTKEEILEYYLNNVYFANGYYGIEAASQAYFHKSSTELSIAQIAFLCAIPNSPTAYDPYKHADSTMKRRNKILKNMYEDGYIDQEQYDKSLHEDIHILAKTETSTNDYAQTYIRRCAIESLMEAQGFVFQNTFSSDEEKEKYDQDYDKVYSTCQKSLYNNGYKIITSIDMNKQKQLQTSISTELGGYFTEKTDDGIYQVQGAAVCIDNSNGKVVAIVGGREQAQEGYGLNRAYQSFRQPGSSIKPILVYAPAFQEGYTPDSIVDDSMMTGKDAVSNAGQWDYDGNITIRQAVKKSSNVATYRLYQTLGSAKCMPYLEKLGFKGLEPDDYKYDSVSLGGFTKGTTPLEMAASYATLANDGEYRRPTCIVSITDADGNEIVGSEADTKSIYSSTSARMMTSVLESCVTEGGTASVCQLDNMIPAAAKTGTTSNYVDGWLCGYTPYYTTAVWVGKDIYEEVENLKGNTYPASIWTSFMNTIHQGVQRDQEKENRFGEYIDSGQQTDYNQYVSTEDTESTSTTEADVTTEATENSYDTEATTETTQPDLDTESPSNQDTEPEDDDNQGDLDPYLEQ